MTREPSAISFNDVFQAVEDELRLVECVDIQSCSCPRLSVCDIVETMRSLHQKVMAGFDEVTVADLIPAAEGERPPIHPP